MDSFSFEEAISGATCDALVGQERARGTPKSEQSQPRAEDAPDREILGRTTIHGGDGRQLF